MPPNDFVLFDNIGLSDADTAGQTSNVGEPSIANNGREIFLTGNWYATRSLDAGGSWSFVSPENTLPPASGGFCCDQIVHYDRGRDLLFWLLQYLQKDNTNTLRLAVKPGATLGNDAWHWWDFRPETTNPDWAGEWFDYPDLELSNDFLYIATNVFRVSDDEWTRSVVLRLDLDSLVEPGALNFRFWETTETFSLRCTRGARGVMHFASHLRTSKVRVHSWPEDSDEVSQRDVDVTTWNAGDYSAPGPDGFNWLARCDSRITGAWVADGVIGLAWTANSRGSRPFPHVRVVRIAENTMSAIGDADLWNSNYAYAYPDTCPNDRGHVGISLFRGGGNRNPGHVVGLMDDFSEGWELAATVDGTDGPRDEKWGDYVACRRHSPDGLTWLASGYTLQGGSGRGDVQPRVVHFGRRRDERAVARWRGA